MSEGAQNADTRAALQEAHEAIKELCMALIVVKPLLDKPYADHPNWTPWTRFVETAFGRGAKAEQAVRLALGGKLMPTEHPHMAGQQKGGNAWEAEEPDVVNQGPATAQFDGSREGAENSSITAQNDGNRQGKGDPVEG